MKTPLQFIKDHISNKIEVANSNIDTFKKDFADSPAYAMTWSNTMMQAAGRLSVYTEAQKKMVTIFDGSANCKAELTSFFENLQSELNRAAASCAPRSSDPGDNLMKLYRMQAIAELLEYKDLVDEVA